MYKQLFAKTGKPIPLKGYLEKILRKIFNFFSPQFLSPQSLHHCFPQFVNSLHYVHHSGMAGQVDHQSRSRDCRTRDPLLQDR